MARFLIRSGKDPFTQVSAEATLAQDVHNTNVGNFLFQHSVFRTLATPGTELVSNSTLSERRRATPGHVARMEEEFDAFVVPLANAFRPEFTTRLENLTTWVEALGIPVVVVGVGAQAPDASDLSALDDIAPVVKRFVGAVLNRSASIGVRGDFTAAYLGRLGFPAGSIEVIGCPSVFLHGPSFRLRQAAPPVLDQQARIALSITKRVPRLGALVDRLVRDHDGMVFVGQDSEDLRLALWGEGADMSDPRLPTHLGHRLFQEDRVRIPLDAWTWLDFLGGFDFSLGTRLHGAIAALLSQTPALLLTHDSRTSELAEYHGLPHRACASLPVDTPMPELYAAADPAPFNQGYAEGISRFLGFLERNGLAHAYGPDGPDPAFDDRIEPSRFPPLVRPITTREADPVLARMRWLRDGQALDSSRHPGAYHHPYPYPSPPEAGRIHREQVRRLRQRVDSLERRLVASRAEQRELARTAARQARVSEPDRRWLQDQERRIETLERQLNASLSRRVWRRLRPLLPGRRSPGG